ncbi:MAG: phosphoenolpyruvate carboxylase, partial [Pseudomonadota bacterium]
MDLNPKALRARLADLYERTGETPLFNPVAQLGFDLSRALEAGAISLADLRALAEEMEAEAFHARAGRMDAFLTGAAANAGDRRPHDRPVLGCVFTAHPTFLLSPRDYCVLADRAGGSDAERAGPPVPAAPTLQEEHEAVLATLGRALDARDAVVGDLLAVRTDV